MTSDSQNRLLTFETLVAFAPPIEGVHEVAEIAELACTPRCRATSRASSTTAAMRCRWCPRAAVEPGAGALTRPNTCW
jgi:hypothetical protein